MVSLCASVREPGFFGGGAAAAPHREGRVWGARRPARGLLRRALRAALRRGGGLEVGQGSRHRALDDVGVGRRAEAAAVGAAEGVALSMC